MRTRPRTCECGKCLKCRKRERERARWAAMSSEERRAVVVRRDAAKRRRSNRASYFRNRDQRLAKASAYAQEHAVETAAAKRAWAQRNPEKRAAHSAVGHALRDGRLQRELCELADERCAGKVSAHHEDYSKPLDVRWLCAWHHMRQHYGEAA